MSVSPSSTKLTANFVSFSATQNAIDSIFKQIGERLHEKEIGQKIAPVYVRKQTTHTFQSFAAMNSKQLDHPVKINKVDTNKSIPTDKFAANSIRVKPNNSFSSSSKKTQKKPVSSHYRRQSNMVRKLHIPINHKTLMAQNQSKTSSIFYQLKQSDQNEQLSQTQRILEQNVKSKKYQTEELEKSQISFKKTVEENSRRTFEVKSTNFKKLVKYCFDYQGDVLETIDFPANGELGPLARLLHARIGTPVNKLDRQDKQPMRSTMFTFNQGAEKGQMLKACNQTISTFQNIKKAIDPFSHLTSDQISEGVRLQDQAKDICKQKLSQQVQGRFRTLKEFKHSIRDNKKFQKYPSKPKKQIDSQEKSLPLLSQQILPQDLLVNQHKKMRFKSQTNSLFRENRDQQVSIPRRRISDREGTQKQKIIVDNVEIFEDLCVPGFS